jgi:tetratricopeptide (TPR) repeat protein
MYLCSGQPRPASFYMTRLSRAAAPLAWRLLLLIPLALLSLSAAAQGQLARYRAGKAQLDQGHYAVAMQALEPLAQPINHFAQAPDAGYLYAVAATRLGKWAEAEQMLNLIRNQYPSYASLNEALYLQGQVSFEQGDYDTALRTLGQQRLQKRYPQSKLIGRFYADYLLGTGALTDADRQQLDALVTQFKLDRNHYTAALAPVAAPAPKALPRKGTYNIGVLLPFELQDNSWQTQRKNQFVTDLYAGLRLAQDSLQRTQERAYPARAGRHGHAYRAGV